MLIEQTASQIYGHSLLMVIKISCVCVIQNAQRLSCLFKDHYYEVSEMFIVYRRTQTGV